MSTGRHDDNRFQFSGPTWVLLLLVGSGGGGSALYFILSSLSPNPVTQTAPPTMVRSSAPAEAAPDLGIAAWGQTVEERLAKMTVRLDELQRVAAHQETELERLKTAIDGLEHDMAALRRR